MDALGGQAILEMDFGIFFSMLERLLGGKGSSGKIVRDLTDIEKVLAGNMTELALNDLKTAWETVLPLSSSSPRWRPARSSSRSSPAMTRSSWCCSTSAWASSRGR